MTATQQQKRMTLGRATRSVAMRICGGAGVAVGGGWGVCVSNGGGTTSQVGREPADGVKPAQGHDGVTTEAGMTVDKAGWC